MALFELDDNCLKPLEATSFAMEGVKERSDLQRILRDQIHLVSPDTMVLAEEFGDWTDSSKRIDLLGLRKSGDLVVIELKRTSSGGHIELQALRYAAMVSNMTFEQAVAAHDKYLRNRGIEASAEEKLLEFLEWEEAVEEDFAQSVAITLVSMDFSKEITSTVIWLNENGLDIRCVRLGLYLNEGRKILDIQQMIPLPEAEEFQVRLRQKQEEERRARKRQYDLTRFDVFAKQESYRNLPKRWAMFYMVGGLIREGVRPEQIAAVVSWRATTMFLQVPGEVDTEQFKEKAFAQARRQNRKFDPKRYFCGDEHLFHINDATYALTNQWGARTEEALLLLIEAFPDSEIRFSRSEEA